MIPGLALLAALALQGEVVTTTGGRLPDRDFHIKLRTAAMPGSVLVVTANPSPPVIVRGEIYHVTPRPSHLFLRVGSDTIQPTHVETFAVTWGNVPGAQFHAQGVTAFFDLTAVPQEDYEVVVIAKGRVREHRATVKKEDRDQRR